MKRISLLIAILLTCILGLSACGKETQTPNNQVNVVNGSYAEKAESYSLIGSWEGISDDFPLIYTFINDSDLEMTSEEETQMATYYFDGKSITLTDEDESVTYDIILSESEFRLIADGEERVFKRYSGPKPNVANGDSDEQMDNQDAQGNPNVSIKLIDDRHADFIFDLGSFPSFLEKNCGYFAFYLPSEYEVEWYGYNTDEEHALMFHTEYGGLGVCDYERNGNTLLVHADLSRKEDEFYVEDFSFASLSGLCRIEYNIDGENTHIYEYDYESILDKSQYTVGSIFDKNGELAGVWKDEESDMVFTEPDGTEMSYRIVSAYRFNSDGTWEYAFMTDSRDADNNYVSVDDEYNNWLSGRKFLSKHSRTYSGTFNYDGEKIRFTSNGVEKEAEAQLDGSSLYLGIDIGRYLRTGSDRQPIRLTKDTPGQSDSSKYDFLKNSDGTPNYDIVAGMGKSGDLTKMVGSGKENGHSVLTDEDIDALISIFGLDWWNWVEANGYCPETWPMN